MKRFLLVICVLMTLFIPSYHAYALDKKAIENSQEGEDYFELPLCLPGMPLDGTCLPFGPAQTVDEMRKAGFPYPLRDLPAAPPSAELNAMPVKIAKINLSEKEPALIYGSFDDAVAERNPISQIDSGSMRYISYVDIAIYDDDPYLQLSTGGWMRASPIAYTDFQGLVFYENPHNDFGWIIEQTPSSTGPSSSATQTGLIYHQKDVIQVYDSVEAEGLTWYQIAPDEWVNSMKARVVSVSTTPPEGVNKDRWIEINLLQQTLSVYEGEYLLFATLVSTGVEPFYTQPGVFEIYDKKPLETMRGSFEADRSDFYYLQDVPWTMYFDQARALHATYWHTLFGYRQSHGCVNLSPGDANWLFQWAEEGDLVWVHDPSGQTPTDAEYYGRGAP